MVDEIRSEHLILGLLSEPEAIAAKTLVAQGIPLDSVRETASRSLPQPAGNLPALIPFDAQTKKALELTFREALRLGHNYVGTEHILLALLELEDGNGILTGLGLNKAEAESQIKAAVASDSRQPLSRGIDDDLGRAVGDGDRGVAGVLPLTGSRWDRGAVEDVDPRTRSTSLRACVT